MYNKKVGIPDRKREVKEMKSILVCDDDKEIVDAIEIYLQQEGYNILKARSEERRVGKECRL